MGFKPDSIVKAISAHMKERDRWTWEPNAMQTRAHQCQYIDALSLPCKHRGEGRGLAGGGGGGGVA